MTRDKNDPTLLGVKIIETAKSLGCTFAQAADYLYKDMREHGYHFGLFGKRPGDEERPAVQRQDGR